MDEHSRVWILTGDGLSIFDPTAGLPVQYVRALSLIEMPVLPAAMLSIVVLIVWSIRQARPDPAFATVRYDFTTIGMASFGAALFGLYALQHRQLLADQIMDVVFGTAWAFNDLFQFFLFPPLSVCVVPALFIVGAALGGLVARLLGRMLR